MRTFLLSQLVTRAAAASPDAVAVVDGDRAWTYRELEDRSNALANVLIARGVQPGDRVGLYLDKSIEAVQAVHAVLKAGAAYVPFDVNAPAARLGFIAADAGINVMLTSGARAESLAELRAHGATFADAIAVDARSEGADRTNPDVARVGEDLAYILYTSGSTGVPKGVMLSHRAALGFVDWAVDAIGVRADDRLSSHAPFHFDLSIFDLFAAAAAGASVALVPPDASRFPIEIRRFIEQHGITIWYSVPSVLAMLAMRGGLKDASLPRLRTILFAGEVFAPKYLRQLASLLPQVDLWNLYGPTETNVCTAFRVPVLDPDDDRPISIGRAIGGDETFVVNEDGDLAPRGQVGTLYVRGATVMSGYWNDPDRTARVLAPSPWHAPLPDLAYCTGDLVRELPSGDYEFLGRRDLQIKSRGYRIELGEIESALFAHTDVVEAAVIAVPDELIGNRIHAFAATRAGLTVAALGAYLGERLPPYMVPDRIVLVEELPKTSTGKIDRQSLAERGGQPRIPTTSGAPTS